jgi:hypothetical protein
VGFRDTNPVARFLCFQIIGFSEIILLYYFIECCIDITTFFQEIDLRRDFKEKVKSVPLWWNNRNSVFGCGFNVVNGSGFGMHIVINKK